VPPVEINVPNKTQIRLIYSFGILLGLSVMAVGMEGLWFEARGLISSNGMASFLKDATMRVLTGLVISFFVFSPFLLASSLYKNLGWPRTVLVFTTLLFLFNAAQMINAFVFSKSSTASLVLIFLPIWNFAALFLFWGTIALLRYAQSQFGK